MLLYVFFLSIKHKILSCILFYCFICYSPFGCDFSLSLILLHIIHIRLSARKAVLVFTHSETLMRAAKIVHVMVDGLIVESGVYNELKSIQGLSAVRDS